MLNIIDCNYCNKTSCLYDYYFNPNCTKCQLEKCSYCLTFNQKFIFLMENASNEAREFIYNFVRDFYSISNTSLNFFYKNNKKIEDIKLIDIVWKPQHFSSKFNMEQLPKSMVYTSYINRKKK